MEYCDDVDDGSFYSIHNTIIGNPQYTVTGQTLAKWFAK